MTDRPASMHAAAIVAVTDLDRARAFYEGQLGLEGSASAGGGWTLAADHGTVVDLLPGVNDAGSASWPVATFLVDDATAVVRDLRSRGVPFLGPDDIPFSLDTDGVSTDDSGYAGRVDARPRRQHPHHLLRERLSRAETSSHLRQDQHGAGDDQVGVGQHGLVEREDLGPPTRRRPARLRRSRTGCRRA